MSNNVEDERRLYQCAKKYEKMVKQVLHSSCLLYDIYTLWKYQNPIKVCLFLFFQFDELIEMMDTRTRLPKRRRVSSMSSLN
jgi:hypothetical protein